MRGLGCLQCPFLLSVQTVMGRGIGSRMRYDVRRTMGAVADEEKSDSERKCRMLPLGSELKGKDGGMLDESERQTEAEFAATEL